MEKKLFLLFAMSMSQFRFKLLLFKCFWPQLRLEQLFNPFTPGRAIWPQTNTVKDNLPGGKVQNAVNVLMAVFYDSLRFQTSYLSMLPTEKRRFVRVLTAK